MKEEKQQRYHEPFQGTIQPFLLTKNHHGQPTNISIILQTQEWEHVYL